MRQYKLVDLRLPCRKIKWNCRDHPEPESISSTHDSTPKGQGLKLMEHFKRIKEYKETDFARKIKIITREHTAQAIASHPAKKKNKSIIIVHLFDEANLLIE